MEPQPRMTGELQTIELDRGPHFREAERLCVATRTVRPVGDLIRFVIGPDGEAVPDLKRKLPGRGVWVTATQEALAAAIKGNAFSRAFKRAVRTPADIVGRTEQLLVSAALDALAMAGKAGLVATGFTRAAAAVQQGDVVALLHAVEASTDGIQKLDGAFRQHAKGRPLVVIQILRSAQLDLALGRPNVVHAALLAGSPSDTFLARMRRLERFRTGGEAPAKGNRRRVEPPEDCSAYGNGCG
jgi:uncharacterized protein